VTLLKQQRRLTPKVVSSRVAKQDGARFDMPADRDTTTFDYGVAAELFMARRKGGARQPLSYRRFATAAEAIRFAIEELPAVRALGAWMQVGDERFDGDDIQRLYESDDYPLQRRLSD
jgi:hypothetical protein